jgi:hypothetical protein
MQMGGFSDEFLSASGYTSCSILVREIEGIEQADVASRLLTGLILMKQTLICQVNLL